MREAKPGAVYLKDYQPPSFLINRTELHFELQETETIVSSRLHLLREPHAGFEAALLERFDEP